MKGARLQRAGLLFHDENVPRRTVAVCTKNHRVVHFRYVSRVV